MKTPSLPIRLLLIATACVCLTGCFGFLKPSPVNTRYFVLTPLPAAETAAPSSGALATTAVGVGFVKLPGYLLNSSVALRKGTNEVNYLESVLWAERLDTGLQRVLAANLATLLPTDRIRFSAWRPEDVNVEVYLAIEQFDVDTKGRGILVAWWRILSPGGEKTLKAGQFRAARQGPSPDSDPQGATATMSELAADLSREIAQGIKSGVR